MIEGTVLENFVHVFGSDTSEDSGRRWVPNRESLPSVPGGSSGGGLTGPFLLVDLGAFVNSIRGTAGDADSSVVGEAAAELAPETEDEGSGRSTLSRVLFLGAALGVAYALSSRLRSVDDPAEETENLAQKAANTIQQRGELAAERIEEGSQTVAERIEERGDETASRISEASETVEGVEETASETVDDVEEGASETAEDVKEDASETAEDVEDDVDDVTDESSSGAKYET